MMITKESGIYKIKNMIITKDFYVGSACNFRNRWGKHRWKLCKNIHYNTDLQRDWNKYGENSFEFSILELCEKEMLIAREQFYFDLLKPTYNINPVAGSRLGSVVTEATRAKLSAANIGKHHTVETCTKMSEARIGTHPSDETRAKISIARIGTHPSEESRAKNSMAHKGKPNGCLGKHHTSESRAKMSESHMGNTSALGHKRTEEMRAKNSQAQKKAWALRREAKALLGGAPILVLTSGDLLPISEGL